MNISHPWSAGLQLSQPSSFSSHTSFAYYFGHFISINNCSWYPDKCCLFKDHSSQKNIHCLVMRFIEVRTQFILSLVLSHDVSTASGTWSTKNSKKPSTPTPKGKAAVLNIWHTTFSCCDRLMYIVMNNWCCRRSSDGMCLQLLLYHNLNVVHDWWHVLIRIARAVMNKVVDNPFQMAIIYVQVNLLLYHNLNVVHDW